MNRINRNTYILCSQIPTLTPPSQEHSAWSPAGTPSPVPASSCSAATVRWVSPTAQRTRHAFREYDSNCKRSWSAIASTIFKPKKKQKQTNQSKVFVYSNSIDVVEFVQSKEKQFDTTGRQNDWFLSGNHKIAIMRQRNCCAISNVIWYME